MKFEQCLRKAAAIALILGITVSVQAETARPEVAKRVQAYATADGVKVWTLRYDAREANQALVQVTDVDHALDEKILLATTQATAQDVRYTVQLEGRPHVLLVLNQGSGELYLPGVVQTRRVSYDEGLSTQGNPEHFLTAYETQAGSR